MSVSADEVPVTFTITVDISKRLAHRGGEPATIEDLIIDASAQQLVCALTRDMKADLVRKIALVRSDVIRENVEPMVVAALGEPVQRTNTWGEPAGEPVTLRELIMLEVRRQASPGPANTNRDKTATALDKTIETEVKRLLAGELKATVDEAKRKLLDELGREAGSVLAKALNSVVR